MEKLTIEISVIGPESKKCDTCGANAQYMVVCHDRYFLCCNDHLPRLWSLLVNHNLL